MVGSDIQHNYCAEWPHAFHFIDRKHSGVLTCGHGKEEKDATQVSRYGMVDEEETASITTKAKSAPV